MRLFQIPFSHNCIKVRHVLDLKGVAYEAVNINPLVRGEVKRLSGQILTPTLEDGEAVVSGSTPILLHIEERHPEPPLLPADPRERAECILLMNWADATFMAVARRIAYFQAMTAPERLGQMFFPAAPPAVHHVAGRLVALMLRLRFGIGAERNVRDEGFARQAARVAVDRLGGEEHLVGGRLSLADITLAAMTAPLQYSAPGVRDDPYVEALLGWGSRVLGADFTPVRPLEQAAAA